MKLFLLVVCSVLATSFAGPALDKETKMEAVLNDIELALEGLNDDEPVPRAEIEGDIGRKKAPRTFKDEMEEMLLHADDITKAEEEVRALGGRVTIQLGHDLLVARFPAHVAKSQHTFTHSSTHISNSASPTTLMYARAYWKLRDDKLKPKPPVMSWTAKTPPMALPREDSDAFIQGESPYSQTMTGKIVVLVLIASGPGSLAITDSERDNIISECQAGLKAWADEAPSSAGLSFALYHGKASISAADSTSCSSYSYAACHNVFADPTLEYFGYPTGQAGKDQLAQKYKDILNANGAFIGFFSKYKQSHFAYAYFGGGPLYMQYSNDGWGSDQIDRVFAHEIGHVFNAPDEYTSCNCYTNYGKGSCTAKNSNCNDASGADCTSSQVSCIMDSNDLSNFCSHTKKHVGWC